jgi:hypothetical protein
MIPSREKIESGEAASAKLAILKEQILEQQLLQL